MTASGLLVSCGDGSSGGGPRGAGRAASSPSTAANPGATPSLGGDPFTLGVASGDPDSGTVVLWTRLAPEPLAADGAGGMPAAPVAVGWELASDDGFRDVVARGSVEARPEFAHAVHVDVAGLDPTRWYWYRFHTGGQVSPAGRTRSFPGAGGRLDRFRFASLSCQSWTAGYYTPYPHFVEEDLDVAFFLGDYIYEGGVGNGVRPHDGPEVMTLPQYRNRYALYKSDPSLAAAHAHCPWVVTWDDHEVENNYAGAISQDEVPVEEFLVRRAAAYQAYYEHLPLAVAPPVGPDFPIFRAFAYGDLAGIYVGDTRQYRTDQPCDDGIVLACPGRSDPAATLLGFAQEDWLHERLRTSSTRWNVFAQQVMMANLDFGGLAGNGDQWDGYPAARQRTLDVVAREGIRNFVVLSGDIHSSWVNTLGAVAGDPSSPAVGSELVATSISSGQDEALFRIVEGLLVGGVPRIHYNNFRERGYVVTEVTPEQMVADHRLVDTVKEPTAAIRTDSSWRILDGRPGPVPA